METKNENENENEVNENENERLSRQTRKTRRVFSNKANFIIQHHQFHLMCALEVSYTYTVIARGGA